MGRKVPIQSFKLTESGLNHIFGDLEARLMEAVWHLKNPTVQQVIDELEDEVNYKTAMTVLNRLVDKGILNRHKHGRAYVYTATASQSELLANVFDKMVRGMFDDEFRQIALAQIVETAESLDSSLLDDLTRLIEARKSSSQE